MRKWCILLSLLFATTCNADVEQWQEYEIHYTTFKSTLIPAKVATAHGITRSDRRIVTNISIRKDNQAVAAILTGTTRNLLSQLFQLNFVEVTEPGAIYYLANQLIDEKDTLRFEVHLEIEEQSHKLSFTRQYH